MSCIATSQPPKKISNFSKANFIEMNRFFYNVNWESKFTGHPNISALYQHFCFIIHKAVSLFVPHTDVHPNKQKAYPHHIQRLIRHRDALFKKSNIPLVRNMYSSVCVKISGKIRRWERNKQARIFKHKGTKSLCAIIKRLTKPKQNLSTHLEVGENLIFDSSERANVLAKTFCAAYTKDFNASNISKYLSLSLSLQPSYEVSISDITFLSYEIRNIMKRLKSSCSLTANSIPQIIFKKCADSLALPLSYIYNISMLDSAIPIHWKHFIVTPLLKPNKSPTDPISYRPISLLCTPLKLWNA